MLVIAIDFDETLTRDAELWRGFIESARSLGHQVFCITARRPTDDNCETVIEWMRAHGIDLPVYFTAMGSKVAHMQELGIKVDIWIDDDPRSCAMGR